MVYVEVHAGDRNEKFLDSQGYFIGSRPTDNLHPVELGFDIWLSSVADTLKAGSSRGISSCCKVDVSRSRGL